MSRFVVILGLLLGLGWTQAQAHPVPDAGPSHFKNDDAFLDYVERQTCHYFWEEANPTNGLIRDRSTDDSPCSIAAVGFGLSAINIGIERGWIDHTRGAERVLRTLQTLRDLPQGPEPAGRAGYHGWFYHFLDLNTGLRAGKSELSSMDTALLMMGVVDAGEFFANPTNHTEASIRQLSAALLDRIDWSFMLPTNDPVLLMAWKPEGGYESARWIGYNEGSCLYLLGLGRATNALPFALWDGWTRGYQWRDCYGHSLVAEPALFTHQYSQVWIDFRGIADNYMRRKGSNYFENSRRATLAQRQYAVLNPLHYPNYGSNEWGFTACDGPGTTIDGVRYEGYRARGAPAGYDDGTIAPTAAASSLPFAPEICLPTLRHIYDAYGTNLWTTEGFRDAYNIRAHWFARDLLGIDQGPIVVMLENYRTGSTWARMLRNPTIQRGLQRAGFTAPPPNGLEAVRQESDHVELRWHNQSSYETGFCIESSTNNVDFSLAAEVGANTTLVSLPVGGKGQGRFYRVRTRCAAGLSGHRDTLAIYPEAAAELKTTSPRMLP
jgi:hypothetical protein